MEQALGFARRQVELAPWDEEGHREIMRLLAFSGQRGAALAQYEACRRALADELDAEPSAETVALYDQIRAGELVKSVGRPEAPPPPHNLPAFLTPLIGREHELAEIGACLADPDCRLLTLVGPGGSGKTRLAVEAAAQAVERYEHGVFFVPLAPLGSTEAIVPAVARALGFSFYEGRNPRQQLLDYLRQKAMLLVLDNYEHLPEGVGLVAEILLAAPKVKVLVTSRARLGLSGEQLFPVGALDLPEGAPKTPTEWHVIAASTQSDAVRLFLSAAQRAWPDFELTADNLPHVIRICRSVEGMPLGILLAAAWANVLQPAEIAGKIGQSLDFLGTEWRDLPPRQRSMRAVFDHSWRLLGERERTAMQALSVFRGSFTEGVAQEIAGTTLRELVGLVNRSLLGHTPGGRYEMHELLCQYAAEKLSQAPDAGAAVRDRHAAYYATALREWAADLKGPRQQAVLGEMDLEIENARAAFEWAAKRGQLERLDEAMEGLRLFFTMRLRGREGEVVFRAAAESLEGTESRVTFGEEPVLSADHGSTAEGLRVLARILSYQASCSWPVPLQQLRKSQSLLDRPELAECDTRRERAFFLQQMGRATDEHDREQARDLYERSLALYQALDAHWEAASVMAKLGQVAWAVGDYDRARQWLEKGLAVFRKLDALLQVAWPLVTLSLVTLMQGQLEESERMMREAFAIVEKALGVRTFVTYLGLVLFAQGKFDEAVQVLHEDITLHQDTGRTPAFPLTWLGTAEAHLGRYQDGRAHAEAALADRREIGIPQQTACTLMVLSWVAQAEGACAQAEELLRESVDLYRQVEQRDEGTWALACLGYAERGLGRRDQAWEHAREALRTGVEIHAFFPLIFGLPLVALLLADEGEVERAVEMYALASTQPLVGNSVWFEDVVGQHIAAAAEGLPPEVVAAARERGRARDLWETARELLEELEKAESE